MFTIKTGCTVPRLFLRLSCMVYPPSNFHYLCRAYSPPSLPWWLICITANVLISWSLPTTPREWQICPPPVLCKFLSCLGPALTVGCHASHAQAKQGSPHPNLEWKWRGCPSHFIRNKYGTALMRVEIREGPGSRAEESARDKACGTICKIPKVHTKRQYAPHLS